MGLSIFLKKKWSHFALLEDILALVRYSKKMARFGGGVRGLLLALALGATAASANHHPLLAQDSPWPACHGNAFASDSTDWPGPAAAVASGSGLTAQLVTHPALFSRASTYLPVSLVFGGTLAGGGQAVWGTSVSAVMLLQVVGEKLQLVDTLHTGSVDLSCVHVA